MYDKELINKVCKLTFSKEELYVRGKKLRFVI